ncbi:hypothetical protein SDC9_107977 [bioreactor metagenome]|uniref:Uncharacterized protein n=1 Tax=bioreactor metagenome TaxID=1076179 RepID=A0A645BD64_9ZZZZ
MLLILFTRGPGSMVGLYAGLLYNARERDPTNGRNYVVFSPFNRAGHTIKAEHRQRLVERSIRQLYAAGCGPGAAVLADCQPDHPDGLPPHLQRRHLQPHFWHDADPAYAGHRPRRYGDRLQRGAVHGHGRRAVHRPLPHSREGTC